MQKTISLLAVTFLVVAVSADVFAQSRRVDRQGRACIKGVEMEVKTNEGCSIVVEIENGCAANIPIVVTYGRPNGTNSGNDITAGPGRTRLSIGAAQAGPDRCYRPRFTWEERAD